MIFWLDFWLYLAFNSLKFFKKSKINKKKFLKSRIAARVILLVVERVSQVGKSPMKYLFDRPKLVLKLYTIKMLLLQDKSLGGQGHTRQILLQNYHIRIFFFIIFWWYILLINSSNHNEKFQPIRFLPEINFLNVTLCAKIL